MDWKKAAKNEQGVDVPFNWLYLHYYEGLTALFRIENALRMFVFMVLKDEKKCKWMDLSIASDDGGDTTIAAAARRRIGQDERFGYLGYSISSPLMHLTSGELIRIIFADGYWPMFASYFPASKEIVRTKLEEIGNIRNALAHFRPIKSDDVEVVKQNANQVMPRIEEALKNLLSAGRQIVPSNTTEAWYPALRMVASPYGSFGFRQSEDEKWIQVRLTYPCPAVGGQPYVADSYRSWRVLTLNTVAILRRCPIILDNVIFVSEWFPFSFGPSEESGARKGVDFVFGRAALANQFEGVKAEFTEILEKITAETELIQEDNLARGEFVKVAQTSVTKSGQRWHPDVGRLRTPLRHDDPPEYWGRRPTGDIDFVTDTRFYPWFPVDVSAESDVPF